MLGKLLDKIKAKPLITALVLLLSTIFSLALLMVIGTIFPVQFERVGLGMFFNQESGVFADCSMTDPSRVPLCEHQIAERLSKNIEGSPPKNHKVMQTPLVPFTLH